MLSLIHLAPSVRNTRRHSFMRLLSSKKATSSTKAFFMPGAVIVYCDSPFCMWMTVFSINFCFLL